jgi:hypothetical protein
MVRVIIAASRKMDMDVEDWLRSPALSRYEALFRENDVDPEVLSDLTDAALEKFDVSFGHRTRIALQDLYMRQR